MPAHDIYPVRFPVNLVCGIKKYQNLRNFSSDAFSATGLFCRALVFEIRDGFSPRNYRMNSRPRASYCIRFSEFNPPNAYPIRKAMPNLPNTKLPIHYQANTPIHPYPIPKNGRQAKPRKVSIPPQPEFQPRI